MDWLSVARHLAERSSDPVVLLDGSARIQFLSTALEEVLGWRHEEVEGKKWVQACVPPELGSTVDRWLSLAMRGIVHQCDCQVVGRDGRRFVLALESSVIGGANHGLLLTVVSVAPIAPGHHAGIADELDYEISRTGKSFGKLGRVSFIGGSTAAPCAGGGRRCYEFLRSRSEPCTDCPVLQPHESPWPRIVVRRLDKGRDAFEVVTATSISESTARVNVRVISQTTLTAIHQAKLLALASRGKLSERERAVMEYLLMGRSIEDIATILGISARTVKFHQANVLEKLGADSRADLVRLVL